MSSDIVGAFRLIEPVGKGGMGVVWRAEHVHQRVPAAVKFITAKFAREPRYFAQFRNEVQAMASLHHPGVAMVFDYGETSRTASFNVADGSPYLAMEWAARGTLSELAPLSNWGDVRRTALEILDALGHAHARGVIHRDLKPQNILVDEKGRLKLADFGLARRWSTESENPDVIGTSGTPRWMAPEQIRGLSRDQGPWTDLYALGCVVFWLLTRRAPYSSGKTEEILRSHLHQPIPRLNSQFTIPRDVESWLRRLLSKTPHDRYRFAADAAHDLQHLSSETSAPRPFESGEFLDPHDADTVPDDPETELLHTQSLEGDALDLSSWESSTGSSPGSLRLEQRPVPPESWVRASAPLWPMKLIGAGLGLWGVRPVPLVDRLPERDALWSALRGVHVDGGVRVVVLRGAAGTGKSRLAAWLGESAHEFGAAHYTYTTHGPMGGRYTALPGMALRHFAAHDLDAAEILGRVRTKFDALGFVDHHFDALSLQELIVRAASPSEQDPGPDARERWWDAWVRYLATITNDRPAILWFDDVQWGAESLGFVERLLAETECRPRTLVLLTVRDETLAERPVETGRIERLLDRDETTELRVEPLGEEFRVELVERLLRLDPSLARKVADRTAGNPLFAVQLVEDWVQRGLLEVGDDGFELTGGASIELPEDVRRVWSNRLERFLASRGNDEASRNALEIAAALGHELHVAEWRSICVAANVDAPPDLFDVLTRDGLVRRSTEGFSFCHGMLRETIEATASAAGRSTLWHSYCADYVRDAYGGERESAERYAIHLVAAERYQEAFSPILGAAEGHARRGDYDRVGALFDLYGELLDRLGHGVTPERVRGVIHRARNAMIARNLDYVDAELTRAEQMVEKLSDEGLRGEVLYVRSRYLRHRGDSMRALPLAEEALQISTEQGDAELIGAARRALGELYRRSGRLDDAIASYTEARRIFTDLGDIFQVGWCEFGLAATVKQRGDYVAHTTHVDAAIDAFQQARSFASLGSVYNEMGDVLRLQGRFEEALAAYDESLNYLPAKYAERGVVELNFAQAYMGLEQWGEARRWLRRTMDAFIEHGRTGALIYVELGMTVCAAGEGQWEELGSLTESLLPKLAATHLSDTDLPVLLAWAGELCEEGGKPSKAIMFWEVALKHWRRLGREDRAEELAARISTLDH